MFEVDNLLHQRPSSRVRLLRTQQTQASVHTHHLSARCCSSIPLLKRLQSSWRRSGEYVQSGKNKTTVNVTALEVKTRPTCALLRDMHMFLEGYGSLCWFCTRRDEQNFKILLCCCTGGTFPAQPHSLNTETNGSA